MKIGFTGTRDGMNDKQSEMLRAFLDTMMWGLQHGPAKTPLKPQFHHGGADGADEQADGIAILLGYEIHLHPCPGVTADVDGVGANGRGLFQGHTVEWREVLPPLVRNRRIVDGVDVLFAAPRRRAEEQRSGTWATIRYARSVGVATVMLWP